MTKYDILPILFDVIVAVLFFAFAFLAPVVWFWTLVLTPVVLAVGIMVYRIWMNDRGVP